MHQDLRTWAGRGAAVLLVVVPLAWLPVTAGQAAAATVDAQCLGTFTRTFTPPVTTTTQDVAAVSTDSYSTCLAGSTGTGITDTTLPLSCLNVTAGPAETETITWNDPAGDTSTIAWGQPVIAGQTVVFAGTVTAGLHQGATAAKITSGISYIGEVVPCLLGTPVTQTTGIIDSLTITGGAAALAAAPAANAAVSATTCEGSSVVTYQPGLTNTAQTVTYTETDTFSPCLSTDLTLTSGTSALTVSLPGASCLAAPSLITGQITGSDRGCAAAARWRHSVHGAK